MNRLPLLTILLLVLAAGGCATKGEMLAARQDIEELKTRLLITEKNIKTVKEEAKENIEKSSLEALKNLETLRKGTADMQANLEAMRLDVHVMTGKIEDVGLAAKKPFDDISLLKEDTSKTVLSMEERLKNLELGLNESNAKIAAISKSLEAPPTPENIYKQAQDALKAGDTQKARGLFARFIEEFPTNKLPPHARYWIGETWYLEKNFEQAVLEYQRVIIEYPGKEKVPAAMLKQAMSFGELGDAKSEKFLLKELIEKFPKSEEVSMARDLLGRIK
jgi:tol-pal system protein YbgF